MAERDQVKNIVIVVGHGLSETRTNVLFIVSLEIESSIYIVNITHIINRSKTRNGYAYIPNK